MKKKKILSADEIVSSYSRSRIGIRNPNVLDLEVEECILKCRDSEGNNIELTMDKKIFNEWRENLFAGNVSFKVDEREEQNDQT